MATLTGKLVADTYKALLKLIDNDILTASEKQISDGFGGGSGVFIDQNGFLRASQFKVTGGTSAQFLKGNGSLDSNTYLPTGTTTTAIAEGTRLYFTTARVLATTLTGFVSTSGTVTASDTILSSIEKIWWNIENGGGGGGGGYVPYIGATQNLNLGTYGLISDFVQFNTTNSAIPTTAGTMSWNNTDGTADLRLKGDNVTLQIGQELVTRVVNKTGDDLLEENYQAVYISGAQGQRLKVDLALAVTDATSTGTLGLVTEDILDNQEGFITTSGLVNKIDTTGDLQGETWSDGDILYLSPTVAGQITNVKPLAPKHTVIMGFVVYAHANNGKIYVKVDNGYEIEELHDVQVIDRTDEDILQWYEDDLVWRNINLSTAITNAGGISGLGVVNYVPKFDTVNSITNSLIYDDGSQVFINDNGSYYSVNSKLTVVGGNLTVDDNWGIHLGLYQILFRYDVTGELRIGTGVPNDFIAFFANSTEKARLSALGYLGVGLTAPSTIIHAKDSTAYGKIIIDNTGVTGGGSFSARQNGTETAIFGVSGAWQANTTSDAAIVATRGGQGIKFYTDGSSTAKGGIDSVGNSFIGQLPAYYAGVTNFIVQGIAAGSLIGITHFDGSIKGIFSTLNSGVNIGSDTPHPVIFRADDIESARIASDGKWLFGTVINDNVNLVQINGSIIATAFKKTGGLATEFLKADGSVDSNAYYLESNPYSFISLTYLSSSATGLSYSNTTGDFSLTAGYVIPTTTSATNWDTAYTNRITSATAPLSITTNVISISQATTSTNGYLSSTDWTTFNNKSNTTGTVTSVSGTGTVSGLTLSGTVTTTGSLTLGGTLSLTSLNVTTALGFTPVTNARTLTINGTTYDLTADRSWTIAAGISTLTTLGTSGPATLVGSTLNVPNYSAGSSAVRNVSTFTATSGQTTFTIIGGYTVGLIDVFINGARLSTADYTATNSSTVVLGTGAVLNDIVDVVNYTATFTAGISGTGTANYITKWTGTSTVSNSLLFDNGTNLSYKNTVATNFTLWGNSSGTNGGSSIIVGYSGVTTIAIGNKSNIIGGTYDSTSTIYWGTGGNLTFNNGSDRFFIESTGAATFGNSVTADKFNGNTQNIFSVNLSEKMRILSTGQVLIGRTTLTGGTGSLEVEQNTIGGYTLVVNSSGSIESSIYLRSVGSTSKSIINSNTDLTFQIGGSEKMRISNSGLGINTTSADPNSNLDVNGQAFIKLLAIYNAAGAPASPATSPQLYSPSSGTLGISVNGSPRVRLSSSGFFKVNNVNSFRSGLDTGHEFSDNLSSDINHMTIYASSTGTLGNVLRIVSDRNTNNGTYNLIAASGGSNEFAVRDSGNCLNTNGSYGSFSDIKLKENIVDTSPKLENLLKVKIRNYNLKSDPSLKQIGVIAQELEEIFPNMIEESIDKKSNEIIKSVKYSVFVPMLIKAIQELKSELDQLKAK